MEIEMDKCHYCENYTSDEKSFYEHTMFEILNTSVIQGMSYRYREKKVIIPRCKKCAEKHGNKILYVNFPIFLLSFCGMIYFFNSKYDEFEYVFLIPCFLASLIITTILSFVFNKLMIERIFGVKPESDIKENLEVKRLLELGWKLEKPSNAEITKEDISKTSPYKK